MLSPYKSCCICISGPPIRKTLLDDSNGWTVVSAGHRYQGSVVIIDFHHVHHIRVLIYHFGIGSPPIPENSRHEIYRLHDVSAARRYTWNSKKTLCTLTFLSADRVALSADPIFLCPFRSLLLVDRSLVSAASLSTSFHKSPQTQSHPQTQRRHATTQLSWSDIPICVRTKKMFANPSFGEDFSFFLSTALQNPTSLFCAHSRSLSVPHLCLDSLTFLVPNSCDRYKSSTSRQCTLELLVICAWTCDVEVSAHFAIASERNDR